ncbi:MAG TPA: hypothetical protein VKY90_21075 [Candidatus Dormibacteraeota bacterium]|nr:hypothetical protein [Candidatus Dormibacteraeota bacterium]
MANVIRARQGAGIGDRAARGWGSARGRMPEVTAPDDKVDSPSSPYPAAHVNQWRRNASVESTSAPSRSKGITRQVVR